MFEVQPYSHDAHFDLISKWLVAHDVYVPKKAEYPEHGVVCYKDETPVAAAFLRRVEGSYAQIDGLVSNPMSGSSTRNECIDIVVLRIMKKARELGIIQLFAISTDSNTLLRSNRHGFTLLPHQVIVTTLKSMRQEGI